MKIPDGRRSYRQNKCDCGEPLPPKMRKCSKCRAEAKQGKRERDKRVAKCSDCGQPLPIVARHQGARCMHCTKKHEMGLDSKDRPGAREMERREKRLLKSRWG